MRSVVLAAGVASRLRPLTERTPKCLLRVGGVPILRRALERQYVAGIDEAVLVTGWLAGEVRAAVNAWRLPLRVRFVDNADFARTNNEYSLYLAAAHVAGASFLLHDGDIVFDEDVLAAVLGAPAASALALRRTLPGELGDEEMKAKIDADGRVLAISKQVPPAEAAGEVPGVTRFGAETSRRLFARIAERVCERGVRTAWYEAALDELVRDGEPLHVADVGGGYLAEIDTPEDLARVDAEVGELRLVGEGLGRW
jgi:choline kinase